MNITLTPFDKPFYNSLLRGAILAFIAAGALFLKQLEANDSTREALIKAGELFFTVLGLRVGEGAIDQQNPVQREADTNK